jgi:glycosyltransferase involved in cell wall biosynthesis
MILGIGELKERLVKLSRELGLNVYDREEGQEIDLAYDIYFMGFMSNPFEYISVSKLFVMSSLWEGFGNTIVESMACGVPVLTSDCRSGPGEIVAPSFKKRGLEADDVYDEEYGVLMPVFENSFVDAHSRMSEKELLWVDTIEKLLSDEKRLNRLRSKGLERANDFSKDIIVSEWKSLIEEVSV